MTLYRCLAWNERARVDGPDGPLWFPRPFQGDGRHDNPDVYGCLYLSTDPLACVTEQLAAFRGQRLIASLLRRRNLPLALATITVAEAARFVDLDDPIVLAREGLRPSRVATMDRAITQPLARTLFTRHRRASGLTWWSTWEAQWINVTLFDRAAAALSLLNVESLTLEHPTVQAAAERFGLRAV